MEPRLFNREDFPFEPLIAALGALIALIILLDLRAINFWLSLLLMVVGVTVVSWTVNHGLDYFKRGRVWVVIVPSGLGIALLLALLLWNNYNSNIRGVTVTVMLSTEKKSDESGTLSIDARISALWEEKVAIIFEKETGAIVKIIAAPFTVDQRLEEYHKRLAVNEIDVYAIDVTWPVVLASYAEDLKSAFGDLNKFNQAIIKNNTVDEKLVAVPWYIDIGLLFYRPRLLEKHGYKPPVTWDELQKMAETIQAEERMSRKDFWGFVWQGAAYEGLTCNALEWQVSHGGGFLIRDKSVDIREPTISAFERAKGWIGTISPPNILEYTEAHTFEMWRQGNAAFMRNWPYAYTASQGDGMLLNEDVGVTLLPRGIGNEARRASTLGGWQLMVNAASTSKEKKAAIEFVRFMTRKDIQKQLATETGKLPTLKELYSDDDIQKSLKFIQEVPSLKNLLTGDSAGDSDDETLVARPSTSTGKKYPKISRTYYGIVHEVLEGKKNALQAVKDLQMELHNILEKP